MNKEKNAKMLQFVVGGLLIAMGIIVISAKVTFPTKAA
jgi:hypothetical protein